MPSTPRITLEQWQALVAVVECGGYARAAARLNKSQSTITYGVQRIEALLDLKVFELQGRRAILTPTGQLLYQRARALVDEAGLLEHSARALASGWEAELRLAVEIVFPNWLLVLALESFGRESPHTRIELIESVIGGTLEAIETGQVHLAITGRVPDGFVGEPLMRARFIAAAHPDHALHRLGRPLSLRDLRAHRHLVVRDTGSTRSKAEVTLDAAQRWTVSHVTTSIEAARMGMGFAWFPEERIRPELEQGLLKPLPLGEGIERFTELYLVVPDAEFAGPGTLRLAAILRESVARACSGRPGMPDLEPEHARTAGDDTGDQPASGTRAPRASAQTSVMTRPSKKAGSRARRR